MFACPSVLLTDVTLEVLRLKFASCEKYPNTVLGGKLGFILRRSKCPSPSSNIVISSLNIIHRVGGRLRSETRLNCGGVWSLNFCFDQNSCFPRIDQWTVNSATCILFCSLARLRTLTMMMIWALRRHCQYLRFNDYVDVWFLFHPILSLYTTDRMAMRATRWISYDCRAELNHCPSPVGFVLLLDRNVAMLQRWWPSIDR